MRLRKREGGFVDWAIFVARGRKLRIYAHRPPSEDAKRWRLLRRAPRRRWRNLNGLYVILSAKDPRKRIETDDAATR